MNYYNDTYNILFKNICWCSKLVLVTQNSLSSSKMDDKEIDMMLFWFLKLRKISSQNVKKERRIRIRKIFGKSLLFCTFFWLLSNRQGYFLTFSAIYSSWLNKGGGLLNLFSWLSFSQSILISFLLHPRALRRFFHFFKKILQKNIWGMKRHQSLL